MKAIYAMVDGNVSGAIRGGTEEKASKHAEKLFILIDLDGDGNLTEKEFLRVSNHETNYTHDIHSHLKIIDV